LARKKAARRVSRCGMSALTGRSQRLMYCERASGKPGNLRRVRSQGVTKGVLAMHQPLSIPDEIHVEGGRWLLMYFITFSTYQCNWNTLHSMQKWAWKTFLWFKWELKAVTRDCSVHLHLTSHISKVVR
jgi:hypothetical protein